VVRLTQRHKTGDGQQQNFLLRGKKRSPEPVIKTCHLSLSKKQFSETFKTPHDRSHEHQPQTYYNLFEAKIQENLIIKNTSRLYKSSYISSSP